MVTPRLNLNYTNIMYEKCYVVCPEYLSGLRILAKSNDDEITFNCGNTNCKYFNQNLFRFRAILAKEV